MVEKPSKLTPALIGGIVLGMLSVIPFVNFANCCCLWVILGGALAAKMLVNRSPYLPVTSGDGAAVGALSGVVGSLVYLVIGIPINLVVGSSVWVGMLQSLKGMASDPESAARLNEAIRELQLQQGSFSDAIVRQLMSWLIISVIAIGVATLGGVIGVALFEKRKGNPPGGYPPQPPNFPGAPYGNPPYGNPPYGNPPQSGGPNYPPPGSPY